MLTTSMKVPLMRGQKIIFIPLLLASITLAMPALSAESEATKVATTGSSKAKDAQIEQMEKESAKLSPEKAKLYNDTMKKAIEESVDSRAQIRKIYEEADALLTAEKFDKKAFLAKASEIDELYNKSRAKLNEAFASAINDFTQQERTELLKARNENRRRRP